MGLRDRIKPWIQDRVMGFMDEMRPQSLEGATGDVLEVGFGTARNLVHYPEAVRSVTGLDPLVTEGNATVEARIARARFPVERAALRADGALPFDTARFDCLVTTWTLCSIPDVESALAEMRRVLKPGGSYLFIEHGRSDRPGTARWQDRLNPLWRRIADGCNMNRPVDVLLERGGFELVALERFRHKGPGVLAAMYRGTATRH